MVHASPCFSLTCSHHTHTHTYIHTQFGPRGQCHKNMSTPYIYPDRANHYYYNFQMKLWYTNINRLLIVYHYLVSMKTEQPHVNFVIIAIKHLNYYASNGKSNISSPSVKVASGSGLRTILLLDYNVYQLTARYPSFSRCCLVFLRAAFWALYFSSSTSMTCLQ